MTERLRTVVDLALHCGGFHGAFVGGAIAKGSIGDHDSLPEGL